MPNQVTSFVGGKSGGGANVGTGLDSIKKGDILIINADSGAVLTGTSNTISTAPKIAFASCVKDGVPIISGVVNGRKLTEGSTTDYVATVPSVKAFGYSSVNTAATLPAAGSESVEWSGAIAFQTDLRLHPNKQDRIDFNVWSKGGYDLGAKIAQDINRDTDENPRIGGEKYFTAELLTDGTKANIGTTATVAVGNGHKTATFSSAHGLAAGDIVYFPGGGTYTVAAVPSTTTITLDYAYQGVTETIAADTAKKVTVITKYGIQVTAATLEPTNPVDKFSQITFEIGLAEIFELTEDVVTAYVRGIGSGWMTRGKEIAHLGTMGYTDRNDTKRNEYPFSTSLDANYNTTSLSSIADIDLDLEQSGDAPQAVFIAFDEAVDTQKTAVLAILTPWAATGGITV